MAFGDPNRVVNKQKRQAHVLKVKKEKESQKRDLRLKRRRAEDKNPRAREERRARNVPATIESKRTWDEANNGEEAAGSLGLSVNMMDPKRRKTQQEDAVAADIAPLHELEDTELPNEDDDGEGVEQDQDGAAKDEEDDDLDSMLGSDSDEDEESGEEASAAAKDKPKPPDPAPSEVGSVATDLTVTPDALKSRFPSLFASSEDTEPKVLITTSINSVLHHEAELLTRLFPNSTYIRRTAHFHSYKYSVREIAKFAAARNYTTLAVLTEDRKKPKGLDIVHLPDGPMFHFSISNWIEGAKIPGHGNPTDHFPELILNGFRTPLGLLTAQLFKSIFPSRPEIFGRQVVTLHNQRDYIFLRRHRYVFRDKRGTEKSIQGADGKPVKGVEDIRAGLQELGPRFTLKLRRVDKGVQRASGQEWEWNAGDEKVRTRFSI
ncbi:hypothetical protein MBLNU230_g2178t1 [Neophaeotheca triangularis]